MAQVRERTQRPANSLDINSRRRLKKIFTADDLLSLSESASDGRIYELVEGKLYEMPPPSPRHGEVTSNIDFLLQTHVRQFRLGRVLAGDPGFVLGRNPDTVRGPDVAYLSYQRFPADEELPIHYGDFVPDLAVEVVSPSDTRPYLLQKMEAWLAAGVGVVWIVDPRRRQVAIHSADRDTVILHPDDTLDGSPVLPGFTCLVGDFFV
jgi:Uma2 family endonuclease